MEKKEFSRRFSAARREIIRKQFASLNDMQQKAVLSTEGPLLLLAGAGSGKTTVLIDRIANLVRFGRASDTDEIPERAAEEDLALLEEWAERDGDVPEEVLSLCRLDPVKPWRILAITFTNKAAGELKSRLAAKLGAEAEDIWAQTFHSAAVRILRRSGAAIGIPSSFAIYDTSDQTSIMRRVMKDQSVDDKAFPIKSVLGTISRAKGASLSPEDYAAKAEKEYDPKKKVVAQLYLEYQKRLRAADALDFDDLILNTVRLLKADPETLRYYQELFRYVLVDEYQDTSHLQYVLASALAGGTGNICVVGDDDQSIYRFRGATIENILSFEKQYKNARCIKLEQNYRSTGHILGAANAVIKNNKGRKGKELWTSAGAGELLKLYTAVGDDEEAEYVAARILGGVGAGMRWGDFAVLYRMNAQSNGLEYALKRNAIPYKVVGGTRFFDRAEIKDVTSYLSVVRNPQDDLRLLRIINTPARGIGGATLERMSAIAAAEGVPLFRVLSHSGDYPELKGANARLQSFYSLLYDLHNAEGTMPLDVFYDYLLDKSGYTAALGTSDEALSRLDNIMELKSNVVKYMSSAEEPTLAGFLDDIALYTDLDDMDAAADSVTLMTVHSAKGLEFPWVFIVGMEDGIFPSSRSIGEDEDMEEERRLCYVALTRAKKRLTITTAKRRMLFGRTSANPVSRFVDEIPDEHIDRPVEENAWDHSGEGFDTPRRGRDHGWADYGGYGRSEYRKPYTPYESRERKPAAPKPAPIREAGNKPSLTLAPGDRINHKAFGEGTVSEVKELPGGDALLTVRFSAAGVKRLMLKAAAAFIEKTEV